jgi:hypothetical protein
VFHSVQGILCRLPAPSGLQRTFIKSAANGGNEPSLPTFCTAANVCNAAIRNWSGEITMFQREVKMRACLGGRGKISIAYWD